jgi:eukaryotic-like serine/threonine-protein kinase
MPIAAGTRLGPYEIESLLGTGGMGEVYRSRDTRLGRTVAVKVLPEHLISDQESRRRFEREARVVSQLSHPHICTLFDVGEQDGRSYIAMEYLEGETLAQRLSRGPLLLDHAIRYGIEIADALDHAHRHGKVVHRDLKPGNVMLTKSGVKLLDFGLAGYSMNPGLAEPLSNLSTMAQPITQKKTMLGTVQYMAPEQLEGGETDGRTDLFALGAVLYEMLTGRKAFIGKTGVSLISAILTSEPPPVASVQPLTPPALNALIRTCLAKDPDERWQTAHDVKLQLRWIAEGSSKGAVPAAVVQRRRWREQIAWGTAALATLTVALLGFDYLRRVPQLSPPFSFTVEPPTEQGLGPRIFPYLSPDGRHLFFNTIDSRGEFATTLRSMDSPQSQILPIPGQANGERWSNDSRHIFYGLDNKVWRMDLEGGAPQIVCEMPPSTKLRAVSRRNDFLLRSDQGSDFITMSPSDCTPRVILKGNLSDYDGGYEWPIFLPDGRQFLFVGLRTNGHHDILAASLDSHGPQLLIRDASLPKYMDPGYLLFEREGVILAQRFDARSRTLLGEPLQAIARQVNYSAASSGSADIDVSPGGTLVYLESVYPVIELRWVDRNGQVSGKVGVPGKYTATRLSPDGSRILTSIFDASTHTSRLVTLDLSNGATQQQSQRAMTGEGGAFAPQPINAAWSPDGRKIAYGALQGRSSQIFVKSLEYPGDGSPLAEVPAHTFIDDWSPDGKFLVVEDADSQLDLLPLEGDGKLIPLVQFSGAAGDARISLDGKWLAYAANEGTYAAPPNVYVRPFNSRGTGRRITLSGGFQPHWSRNGQELYYLTPDYHVVVVTFSAPSAKEFQIGPPKILFSTSENTGFDIASDGKRFLIGAHIGEQQRKVIVTINFGSTLAALLKDK